LHVLSKLGIKFDGQVIVTNVAIRGLISIILFIVF